MTDVTERQRWLFLILSLVAGWVVLTVFNLLYINRVDSQRDRDFCAMIKVFDDPSQPPPATQRGLAQVRALHEYRVKRC